MRILFLASKCILDRRSGAAVEMKTVLEVLAVYGFSCHSITMTCFDGDADYPLERLIGEHADPSYRHYFLEAWHRGVCHRLFYTASTSTADLERSEVVQFGQGVAKLLDRIQPDLVITSGEGTVPEALARLVKEKGVPCACYVPNPYYRDPNIFRLFDRILCPTRALAHYYAEQLGIEAKVLRNVFTREQFLAEGEGDGEHRRQRGWITLVNPSPEKGAILFFELVRMAAQERPDLRFAAVEARASRELWRRAGQDPVELGNLYWLRNRSDMRPVLRRTAVLLFPSLWFEAAGRLPVEAQLSGIPVVASRRGALPEQLNGGGFLLDPPAANQSDFLRVPTPGEVRPWLDQATALVDDPHAYAEASEAARRAAAPFHPDRRLPAVAEEIADLVRSI